MKIINLNIFYNNEIVIIIKEVPMKIGTFCQYITRKFLYGIFKSILQTYSSHYYLYSYICIRPIHKLIHLEVNNYAVQR